MKNSGENRGFHLINARGKGRAIIRMEAKTRKFMFSESTENGSTENGTAGANHIV